MACDMVRVCNLTRFDLAIEPLDRKHFQHFWLVQVYKGILHGSTSVAIKFITRQTHKEKLRFVSEIHILKNLRHVNVSPLLLPLPQPEATLACWSCQAYRVICGGFLVSAYRSSSPRSSEPGLIGAISEAWIVRHSTAGSLKT